MSHPDDLLADYVEGTLDERGRADVDSHLLGCERCRGEVREARKARAALAQVEDLPVPFGVTGRVLAEAGRRFEHRRGIAWDRFRWATGIAAAAAIVVVVVLSLGDGDSRDAARPAAGSTGATGATGAESAGAASPGPVRFLGLERQPDVNYDDAGIRGVASQAAGALLSAEAGAGQGETAFASAAQDAATRTSDAKHCVEQSGLDLGDPRDDLIRLIEAEYRGTPAYIAVFAEGPGAGQPPDHIVVWVVATDDCRILTTASQRITRG